MQYHRFYWALTGAFACLLSLATGALALPKAWTFNQCRTDAWGVRDGLPAYQINAINQTPDGFIWLATNGGLVRFDGASFDRYTGANVDGLATDKVTALTVDKGGKLYLGDVWGGYGAFSGGRFNRLGPATKLYNMTCAMLTARDGTLWVSVRESGPYLYHLTPRGTERYLAPDGVVGIAESPTGDVVCAVEMTGLFHVQGNALVKLPYSPPVPLSSVAFAADGSLWCGTRTHGICHIVGGRLQQLTVRDGLPSDNVNTVMVDHEGGVWIGTTAGMASWNGYGFVLPRRLGAVDADVTSIFEDREGNLWIGTAAGLCRASATRLVPYAMLDGMRLSTMGQTSSIAAASVGGIWCATDTGLWRLFEHQTTHYSIEDREIAHIETISEAPDGTVWGWTRAVSGAILLFHLKPGPSFGGIGKATVLWKHVMGGDVIAQNLAGEKDGVTIFGTDNIYHVGNAGAIRTYPTKTGFTFAITGDPAGGYWIGCEQGLCHYASGVTKFIDLGLPPGDHVVSVDVAIDGGLWMVAHVGLIHYVKGAVKIYSPGRAIPSGDSFQVLDDVEGRLWFGGDDGLSEASLSDFDSFDRGQISTVPSTKLGAADGVQSYPVTFSSVRDSSGKLWFGSNNGVTCVDRHEMFTNNLAPPVLVEGASLDGKAIDTHIVSKMRPGAGELAVRFGALTFAARERVRIRHILEGFESTWSESSSGEAKYTNLPPGRYTFRVIACNDDGIWNNTGDSFTFDLQPHYYQTLWFRCLCAGLFLLAVIGIYRLRVRAVVRHAELLETVVAERTAELISSNDELQSMQAELEAQNDELTQTREYLASANALLGDLATTDGLTGIKNHRAFQECLDQEWKRFERDAGSLSVILLDVDRFKQYNDTYGHPGGDQVLKSVARILSTHARDIDFVARYGGEEFVIVAVDADSDGAMLLAERLRAALESEPWPEREVTASFGVATAAAGISTPAGLIAAADSALYRSKQDGRNRVTHFDTPAMKNAA